MSNIQRVLTPNLNPNGLMALAASGWALGVAIWNVAHHHGAIDPQVIVAALGAFLSALSRQVVTPVADPRDGNGTSLKPPPQSAE